MKFRKGRGAWGVVLSLALLLRLVGLDLNPVGLSHDDELHDLINAKSLAITGENTPGVVAGILTPNGHCLAGDCVYAELESFAQIPWMRVFPFDMVFSKIPFVLASVALVWATGKLFENISDNKTVGIITGFLLSINPWAIYYGRTAYSYNFSFLLFILAAYFFTRDKSYKSNLIWGGLLSFTASLFYFGAKPIFPLVIFWGIAYNLYQFKVHHIKFTLLFGGFMTVITGSYFFLLASSLAGKRFLEIEASNTLISERIGAYLGFFSPVSLFLTGQRAGDNYFISGHGYFYLIEFPFLILGIIAMLLGRRKNLFIFALIVIAVIPAFIKTSWASIYSLRTALAYPLITGIIGWGYYYGAGRISFIEDKYLLVKKFFIPRVFLIGIGILYLLSVTYFSFLYWHRLPVEQASRWFFHERVMANYISRVKDSSHQNILVLAGRPDGIFNSYVFFGGIYNEPDAIRAINKSYLNESFEYDNVRFISDCGLITEEDKKNSIIFTDQVNQVNCNLDQKNSAKIANPKDAGGMFNILNESLCAKYPKNRFPTPKSIFDFKPENLSDEDFCKIWITNPDNY